MELGTEGFWSGWLRIWTRNLDIQNGGSNMADEIKKFAWFGWKLVVEAFWGRWLWMWAHNSEFKKNCNLQNLKMAD